MITSGVLVRRQRLLGRLYYTSITEIRGLRMFLYSSLDNDVIAKVFLKEPKAPLIFQLPAYSINAREEDKHQIRE